jgi:hypothetical protein
MLAAVEIAFQQIRINALIYCLSGGLERTVQIWQIISLWLTGLIWSVGLFAAGPTD